MTRPHWLLIFALAVMTCVLGRAQDGPTTSTVSGGAFSAASDTAELAGKIVAITLFSDVDDLILISGVSEKRIGTKAFLQGTGVDDGETPDWRNGALVYVPVDDIQQLVAFADLKAYRKNLNSRLERSEGKAASLLRPAGRTGGTGRSHGMISAR